MQSLRDLIARASEYPKHQVFRDVHPYLLDFYFEQLNKLEERLFHGTNRARVNFWECSGGEQREFLIVWRKRVAAKSMQHLRKRH